MTGLFVTAQPQTECTAAATECTAAECRGAVYPRLGSRTSLRLSFALSSVALAIVLLGALSLAHADAGELALGPTLSLGLHPATGALGLSGELGLSDWLATRASASATLNDAGHFGGRGLAGLVAAWDVLSWVPELVAVVGVDAAHNETAAVLVALSLGLRGYWSLDWSWEITAGGGLRRDETFGMAALTIWRG